MTFGIGKNDSTGSSSNFDGDFKMMSDKDGSSESYIGIDTCINGEVKFEGVTYLNCTVTGNITAAGPLTIGPQGEIKGNIEGTEVNIMGRMEGDVNASISASLDKPGELRGNINCPKVSIADGVVFNGQCSMKSPGEIVDLKREATL